VVAINVGAYAWVLSRPRRARRRSLPETPRS
jgi:hypothetical protein